MGSNVPLVGSIVVRRYDRTLWWLVPSGKAFSSFARLSLASTPMAIAPGSARPMILDCNRRIDAFKVIEIYPHETCSGNVLRSIGALSASADCKEDDKSTTASEPSLEAMTVLEKHLRGCR
jgi:hypothetical protein